MTEYARVDAGVVVELFSPPEGFTIEECFHADLAATFVPIGATVPEVGWGATETGGVWTFSAAPVVVVSGSDQLATCIAAGIIITCTGNPALNATYALDSLTLDQISSVARDSASGIGLPGGLTTFTYPDATGTPRTFTGPQIIALYKAMRDLLLNLNTQAAMAEHGAPPSWPAQIATIA